MAKSKKHGNAAHYDIDIVKSAAENQWATILSRVGGVSSEILDGKHHPCPKCGGTDRFRFFTDGSGGAICNQCHRDKCGDGLATLEWLTGLKFYQALGQVAELLGVPPAARRAPGRPRKDGVGSDPAADLVFEPWNEPLVMLWCQAKPPITPAAVAACGGRLARYRNRFSVIALPVYGEQLAAVAPIGWVLYNLNGRTLPKGPKRADGSREQVKVKLTFGSQPGIMGPVEAIVKSLAEPVAPTFFKVEGPTDLLAWLSLPDAPMAWTNANGALERPPPWIPKFFAGATINIVHDADKPGQEGATYRPQADGQFRPGWAPALHGKAGPTSKTIVRNVVLPYPIEESHGKDLRDWVREGGTVQAMQAMVDASPIFQPLADAPIAGKAAVIAETNEAPDNFHRLARINLYRYSKSTPRGDGTLRFYKNEWYKYVGTNYQIIEEEELKAKVGSAVKEEFDRLNMEEMEKWDGKGAAPTVRNVGCSLISNVAFAMAQMRILSGSVRLNAWIDGPLKGSGHRYLACQNGILDLDALLDGKDEFLLPHTPNWFSVNCLPFDFDPDAKCPKWQAFLQKNLEGDQERIAILREWAGYLLLPATYLQKFLLLEGEGANGKSVYLAAIEAMVGSENCSHIPLEAFSSDFMRSQIVGKLLNIASECSEMDQVAEGFLKGIASGDPMTMNRKGLPPIEHVPTARLMLATNVRPRFSDKSSGLWRRILLIPWRITIQEHERVLGMDTIEWWKNSGELPGILNWALAGLHQLRANRRFTRSAVCDAALADYQHEVNPAKTFLSENYVADHHDDSYVPTQILYKSYCDWSEERGHRKLSDRTFGREVQRTFPKSAREQRRNPHDRSRFYVYAGIRPRQWRDDATPEERDEDLVSVLGDDFV